MKKSEIILSILNGPLGYLAKISVKEYSAVEKRFVTVYVETCKIHRLDKADAISDANNLLDDLINS